MPQNPIQKIEQNPAASGTFSGLGSLVPVGMMRPSPRARSLILTAWGDSIMPLGGRIWLGSLIQLMAPLGLDERLVRTSVQRLSADGWLAAEAFGRRRDILMPSEREAETRAVQARMYTTTLRPWDGTWHIIVTAAQTPARREALRRELDWAGYVGFSPNQFIHRRDQWPELRRRLIIKGLTADIAHRFSARFDDQTPPAADLWPIADLAADWRALDQDLAVLRHNIDITPPNGHQAFAVRTLMVHTLRRLVLKDPDLPGNLLPDDWPAGNARRKFQTVWQSLQPAADDFTSSVVIRCDGQQLPETHLYVDRFQD